MTHTTPDFEQMETVCSSPTGGRKMKSIWENDVTMPSFPCLDGERRTDVLIIGGGMAGILCLYFLQKYGVDCCLVETGNVAGRVSGHTTAKITAQHGLVYQEIADRYGLEAAKRYYTVNQTAVQNYRTLSKEMKCDWEEKDNYVYSVKNRGKLEREMNVLEKIGGNMRFDEILPLPFPTCGSVVFPNQAQFHPLKFLAELTKPLKIYENTKVTEFGPCSGTKRTVFTNRGTIRANAVIVTTHFPMLNKHGNYFMKLYQHRSYVTALKGAPHLPGMYVDEDKTGFSFRTAGDFLLLGGGGHRTGKQGGSYTELRGAGERFYPEAEEVCRFAAQDCMSLDGIPYIGKYSKGSRGLFVATGFNKWGMTSSMVAAMVLSDLVRGKKNEYEDLFSPSRPILTGQLAINLAESVAGLLSVSGKRCPHLGCALKWNKEEHSWDCPCHGSRFSEDGTVLDNPANGNLK